MELVLPLLHLRDLGVRAAQGTGAAGAKNGLERLKMIKIVVDAFGFGSFMLIFQFVYIPIKDELPGWQIVLITVAALIPAAIAWHYLYAKARQNEE